MTVRVRFAPSPTGHLHIGGARTALFNWLFAKKTGGAFLFRIEDTGELRANEGTVRAIFEGMDWLGLDWDEGMQTDGTEKGSYGPYFQAVRMSRGVYKPYAEKLINEGKAYYCYCTAEELDDMRKQAQLEKGSSGYGGKCRRLTKEQIAGYEAQGRKP